MKTIKFNQSFIKVFTLITLCFTAFSFTTKFGLDSYEIYLNNTLIMKQTVDKPLSLRTLQLDKAKESDQLGIKYTHCTNKGVGTDRSIVLKNEKGNKLRKWVFANATGSDFKMTIAVKELLQLQKTHGDSELTLVYVARELPKGEVLALIRR